MLLLAVVGTLSSPQRYGIPRRYYRARSTGQRYQLPGGCHNSYPGYRHMPDRWINVVILGAGMPCSLFANHLDDLSTCRRLDDVTTVLESTRYTAGDLSNGTHAAFMVVLAHFDFWARDLNPVVDVAAVRLALVAGPAQSNALVRAVTATYGV